MKKEIVQMLFIVGAIFVGYVLTETLGAKVVAKLTDNFENDFENEEEL
jgi:hypothetical protein